MAKSNENKKLNGQQPVNAAVKSICNIMRRGNCAGALQYVPELTWILFLRILDEKETKEAEQAEAVKAEFTPSLEYPYRWQDWAAEDGKKRRQLQDGAIGDFFSFVNTKLLPYLKTLEKKPTATARQKVISEIMSGVERVRIDTEKNFLDVLDKVHELTSENIDDTHVFTLSQVYEGLLLKMGEKGNDGGQFFTPREVIRAMVRVINPKVGDTIYDPGCGTGGFLAQSYEYMAGDGKIKSPDQFETLKTRTFYGREKENLVYPVALANLILHGIDKPNIWHGNTLTGNETYGGLFEGAPPLFNVILTNPPFGGKESKEAQTRFAYQTGATQVLFLQHVINSLDKNGRCGIVLDEGLLFRANEDAFVKTKRMLLEQCNLWCILSLPAGVFTAAGAGVKTNLLFFTKGKSTEKIWYYDLSDLKIRKKIPLTISHFDDFFKRLKNFEDSELSWTINIIERKKKAQAEAEPFRKEANEKKQKAARWKEKLLELKKAKGSEKAIIEAEENFKAVSKEVRDLEGKINDIESAVYDLKAVNPNKKAVIDTRTPSDLLDLIETKGHEITEALTILRKIS